MSANLVGKNGVVPSNLQRILCNQGENIALVDAVARFCYLVCLQTGLVPIEFNQLSATDLFKLPTQDQIDILANFGVKDCFNKQAQFYGFEFKGVLVGSDSADPEEAEMPGELEHSSMMYSDRVTVTMGPQGDGLIAAGFSSFVTGSPHHLCYQLKYTKHIKSAAKLAGNILPGTQWIHLLQETDLRWIADDLQRNFLYPFMDHLSMISFAKNRLSYLPAELITHICKFMDYRPITSLSATCTRMQAICTCDAVWRRQLTRRYLRGLTEAMMHKMNTEYRRW